jgi:magnesium-transporting ATPase (P-type)
VSSPDSASSPFEGIPESQQVSASSRRPTGVTVFAILSILFGIIGLLGSIGSLLMFRFSDSINTGMNPVQDLVSTSVAYRIFYFTLLCLGIIFASVLLVSGIGLLKMSNGARKLVIIYAVYAILVTIGAKVVNLFAVYAPMLEQMGQQAEEQQIIAVVIICVAVVSAIFSLIFPIAILIYFLRPSVKQTFLNWERTTAA